MQQSKKLEDQLKLNNFTDRLIEPPICKKIGGFFTKKFIFYNYSTKNLYSRLYDIYVLKRGCGNSESTIFDTASTEDVVKGLDDESVKVIDARLNDIFNGWSDADGNRGGHIDGALDFSSAWIDGIYDEESSLEEKSLDEVLAETIETKGLETSDDLIIYDTNGEDAQVVAEFLSDQGFENIRLYDAAEWITDESKELVSFSNYELVVSPQVVDQLINGETPEGFDENKDMVIVNVAWGAEDESGYLDGHIPTAVHVNTDRFEPPMEHVEGIEEWRLADPDTLVELLLEKGITKDTLVIATGPEPMASSRFAYLSRYLGVEDVRVLNGGLVNWQNQGYELETEANETAAAEDFGGDYPANPEMLQNIEDVKDNLVNNDDYQLLDVRTWEEYIGETPGYSYHDVAGRIEGAIFGRAGLKNSSSMYFYRNPDKTMRNLDEIANMWEENGVDLDLPITFMCGSGWRVAESYWYSLAMGRTDDNMFSDGWIAWSNEGNPFATGVPEGMNEDGTYSDGESAEDSETDTSDEETAEEESAA